MSTESQVKDEIDLNYTFKKFRQALKGLIKLVFRALDFISSKWYIIIGLIAVGLVLGYYLDRDKEELQTSRVLLKTNYRTGEALYNAVDAIANKIYAEDKAFFESLGFDPYNPQVNSVALEPVIKVRDVVDYFREQERTLDPILRYVDFNLEGTEFYETFTSDYNYHYLTIGLSASATEADIQTLLNYINNEPNLKLLAETTYTGHMDKIKANEEILKQTDSFLEKYLTEKDIISDSGNGTYIEAEERPDLILEKKDQILRENRNLRQLVVFGPQSITPINGLEIYPMERSILSKKIVFYPVVFVLLFLALAYLRYLYFYLRKIANA